MCLIEIALYENIRMTYFSIFVIEKWDRVGQGAWLVARVWKESKYPKAIKIPRGARVENFICEFTYKQYWNNI